MGTTGCPERTVMHYHHSLFDNQKNADLSFTFKYAQVKTAVPYLEIPRLTFSCHFSSSITLLTFSRLMTYIYVVPHC
jgi:hypothetical protein